ncbi:MAG: outer membrane protein assembly factor BamB family protein [Polyangia bacterium]
MADDDGAQDWPMYGHDISGSRHAVEHKLSPHNVGKLKIEWSFATAGVVNATPIVVGGTIYAGDAAGQVYALSDAGKLKWSTKLAAPVTASALVRGRVVVVGDQAGFVYGLDRSDGKLLWKAQPNPHPFAAIYSSATPVGDLVALGTASNEEDAPAVVPGYHCCTFRGSVVMLDPRNGAIVWQTYTVSDADYARGVSGSAVWTTPAYDPETHLLYVATGNNYSEPTNGSSDAVIALDARSGKIVWLNQRYPDDSWNFTYLGDPAHPDYDFGDSPQLYRLADGRKVVGTGQKSGFYHVLDAATGKAVHQIQVDPGSSLGGLFADSAYADGVVFANGLNWDIFNSPLPASGDLIAIAADGSKVLWRFGVSATNDSSGVAVANGVVYFQSELNGTFYALDARSGALLATVPIGMAISGPAVSRGHIYVGTGDDLIGDPGAATRILSLGVDSDDCP